MITVDSFQRLSYLEWPLPLFLLIGSIGLVRAWRQSKGGDKPWLLTISTAGIFLVSMNLVAWTLSRPLEIWYENRPIPKESAEAIVILAGAVHPSSPNQPYTFAGQDTYRRLQHGIWLFKHWKSLPILVCGGSLDEDAPAAETMKGVLESQGIPADLILIEDRSRSTHESAKYGSYILRQRAITRVALVVEANSMLRAAASFRKAGVTVIPAPIRFTALDLNVMDIFPNWGAIALNGETVHEVIGLVWYRLRGWI